MLTAMNSIESMVDVNTIIGEPIETANNIVIIPISKVSFGFAAGGSEFKGETIDEYTKKNKDEKVQYRLPFGGGSGAGVSINPIAFLIVENDKVRLLPVNHTSCIDKMLDYIPDLFERIGKTACKLKDEEGCESEQKVGKEEKRQRASINKAARTTEEKLEYKPIIKKEKENEEIAEELEELFEEEFEYDDD
jgi:sporulation protein YtfJ